MGEIILGVTIFSVLVCAALGARYLEKKDFNGGFCGCGQRWRRYDVDSQGGRGYTCDGCNKGVWVSYRSIDRAFIN